MALCRDTSTHYSFLVHAFKVLQEIQLKTQNKITRESFMKFFFNLCFFLTLSAQASIQNNATRYHDTLDLNAISRGTLMTRSEEGGYIEMPIVKSDIKTVVTGQIARTVISQTFKNESKHWLEAMYLFPLPNNSAVDQMRMLIGDRVIEGQIKEKQEAKKTYEKAKTSGKRAALVEQHRPNIFNTSVSNIPPNGDVVIEIEYQESLAFRDAQFTIRIPTAITPRYSPRPPTDFVIDNEVSDGWSMLPGESPQSLPMKSDLTTPNNNHTLEIILNPGFQLEKVESPYHEIISTPIQEDSISVKLVNGMTRADRDFVLNWKPQSNIDPSIAFYSEQGKNDRFGLMTLLPPTIKSSEIMPREVTFIIDTSGSMSGQSIVAARRSLMTGINLLSPGDTFNIIEFNDSAYPLFKKPQSYNPETLSKAMDLLLGLEASGGTNMLPAVDIALATEHDPNRFQQIVFITDGSVSNEDEVFHNIHFNLGKKRFFTVGIGSAPNSFFMEESARAGRGTYTYIAEEKEAEQVMKNLFRKISKPALTDIKIISQGIYEVTPDLIPDLYQEEPLMVAMKLSPSIKDIQVTGRLGGQAFSKNIDLSNLKDRGGIEIDWARKKIGEWQRTLFKGTPKTKVRKEVLELALKHHLVSPYTSLVAVDVTPIRPGDEDLKSNSVTPTKPKGLKIKMNKTATGYEMILLVGIILTFLSWLMISREKVAT